MTESYEPVKLGRLPNGAYVWNSAIDPAWFRSQLMTAFKASSIIDVVLVACALGVYLATRDLITLVVFGVIIVSTIVIVGLVFGLTMLLTRNPVEHYTLYDTFIQTGYGRNSSYFTFEKTKILTITRDYVELRGRFFAMRVYAPAEDFEFVRNYIKNRMPGETDIRYQ